MAIIIEFHARTARSTAPHAAPAGDLHVASTHVDTGAATAAVAAIQRYAAGHLADINVNLFTAGSLTSEALRKLLSGEGPQILDEAELDEALFSSVKACIAIVHILSRNADRHLQRAMREWLFENGESNV